jgi:hypothetical protein
MGRGRHKVGALIAGAAVVLAIVMASCGGSSESSDTTAEFKGDNPKLVKFGREANAGEREAASSVLEENLKARETEAWVTQCSTLSAGAVKHVEEKFAPFGAKPNCEKSLELGATPYSSSKKIRTDTMIGPIDALRVQGNRGFALYHGAKGKDYAIAMRKEGDKWTVAAIVTKELSG